jgi:hypothetical protein
MYERHCDFLKSIDEFFGNTFTISGLENLVFNPFDMNDEHMFNPLQDIDPDVQYYSDIAMLNQANTCNYYVEDSFNNKLQHLSNDCFSLFHINIRSMQHNLDGLLQYLEILSHSFSIIGLSETWLTVDNHTLFDIPNYKHLKAYRSTRVGGGVSIFVKENLKYQERNDLSIFDDTLETLFIEINKDQLSYDKNVVIGLIYRPPNTSVSEFNKIFTCESLSHKIGYHLIYQTIINI